MNESDKESASGFWLVLNFLAICTVAAVAIPNFVPVRSHSCMNACVNNLRQMDGAVQQWALENKKKPEDKVTPSEITPYLKSPLVCPQGGFYKIGPTVTNVPACTLAGHALPP